MYWEMRFWNDVAYGSEPTFGAVINDMFKHTCTGSLGAYVPSSIKHSVPLLQSALLADLFE